MKYSGKMVCAECGAETKKRTHCSRCCKLLCRYCFHHSFHVRNDETARHDNHEPCQPESKEKRQPILDPSDPTLYPEQSGSEIEEILKYSLERTEFFNSIAGTLHRSRARDIWIIIMRLAAYVKTLERPQ